MKKHILTIPNIITFIRILFIPFIIYFLYEDTRPQILIALILYILSAVTDTLDGFLARKLHQESALGAYLDPLADKILVNTLFIVFALKPDLFIGWWAFILFLARDIFVTRLRDLARKKDIHFKTSFFAKAKTVSQMLTIAYILTYMTVARYIDSSLNTSYNEIWSKINPSLRLLTFSPFILTVVVILFTIASGIDYGLTYHKALKDSIQNNTIRNKDEKTN